MRQARLTEMDLVVDHTRQQELTVGIDKPGPRRQGKPGADSGYAIAVQQHVSVLRTALVNEAGVLYKDLAQVAIPVSLSGRISIVDGSHYERVGR